MEEGIGPQILFASPDARMAWGWGWGGLSLDPALGPGQVGPPSPTLTSVRKQLGGPKDDVTLLLVVLLFSKHLLAASIYVCVSGKEAPTF